MEQIARHVIPSIARSMVVLATGNGIPEQALDTWSHSLRIWQEAARIAAAARERQSVDGGLLINEPLLEALCFAHDTGRMFTGSKASHQLVPQQLIGAHGVLGAHYYRTLPEPFAPVAIMEALARICERHLLGVGVLAETYERWRRAVDQEELPDNLREQIRSVLGMPRYRDDTLPETAEERIMAYVDLCALGQQTGSVWCPVIVPYHGTPRARLLETGGAAMARRGDAAHAFVLELTGRREWP